MVRVLEVVTVIEQCSNRDNRKTQFDEGTDIGYNEQCKKVKSCACSCSCENSNGECKTFPNSSEVFNANIEMNAITKLSRDIHELFSKLASRIEKLEQNVEQKILKHFR